MYTLYTKKKTPKNLLKNDTLHSIEWFTLEKKPLKNVPLVQFYPILFPIQIKSLGLSCVPCDLLWVIVMGKLTNLQY